LIKACLDLFNLNFFIRTKHSQDCLRVYETTHDIHVYSMFLAYFYKLAIITYKKQLIIYMNIV